MLNDLFKSKMLYWAENMFLNVAYLNKYHIMHCEKIKKCDTFRQQSIFLQ